MWANLHLQKKKVYIFAKCNAQTHNLSHIHKKKKKEKDFQVHNQICAFVEIEWNFE